MTTPLAVILSAAKDLWRAFVHKPASRGLAEEWGITSYLYSCTTIIRQGCGELIGMNDLGQALQAFYQARTWTLDDIYVDVVHLVRYERGNIAPVGTFVDRVDIAAIRRVLSENNVLWIGADNCF